MPEPERRRDDYNGLLFIGDPHLATRAPGWRRDEYPQTVLAKLRWCVEYAREHRLLTVILGDLFHYPREISNQLLVEVLCILSEPAWCVAGNHDCHENSLTDDDSLSVLQAAGCIKLLERAGPWVARMNGMPVIVGGTCWGAKIPESFDPAPYLSDGEPPRVFWVTHHDLRFPGNDSPSDFDCCEIPGIDVVINGHIHRELPEVRVGGTTWLNPGNIARVQRSDIIRAHVPGALRIDIGAELEPDGWRATRVEVPHKPFDEVFHAQFDVPDVEPNPSSFVKELAALESIRTASGAGLSAFLEANLGQFEPRVANEIRLLAKEVLGHED